MTGCYNTAQRRREHGKIENHRKCVTLNRDHGRHGRTSLHAELPSSKAKREQMLRNILAARRRHILNQRSHESSRILSNPRTSRRPGDLTAKDPPDIFETQETKHTIYVTSARTGISPDEEIAESSRKPIALITNIDSTNHEIELRTSKVSRNEISLVSTTQNHDGISTTSPATIFAMFTSISQKAGDTDVRKRNIVSMPESLYNHFRPVESNIPVEDMSQFLYFGQKLQPDTHNITTNSGNNNSVEFTSTVPTSRRRYSTKRFSATIVTPVEEIVNDEMNIALERRTVEKNQVSRIKNTFRSPGSGSIYYRKSGPKDVMSNVIPSNESSSVISRSDTRSEINSIDDKFRSDLPVHAEAQTQLQDGESTMSQVNSTIQHVSTDNNTKENVTRSDVNVKSLNETIAISSESTTTSRQETTNEFQNHDEETQVKKVEKTEQELTDIEIALESSRISTRSRESNNIETSSTIHDKERTTPVTGISTLRIVVPEENFGQKSFATESERAHRNTVKQPVNAVVDQPVSALVNDNVSAELSSTTESFTPVIMTDQQQQQQQQQQHVYAYTITNVTRLLRNYTVLGSSAEEERRDAVHRDTGAEITTSGSSQQHQQQQKQEQEQQQQHSLPPPPPPSSPLLLPRAGSGIEPARIAEELSAGVTVEPAAADGSPFSIVAGLVGERLKKVVPQQRATNQQATPSLHSNANDSITSTSTSRSIKSTNIGYRGSIKWNHTKSRISDEEAIGDRRFLRKSASAVLNQRSTVHEDPSSSSSAKRRGLSTFQSGAVSSTANNKRAKSSDDRDKIDSVGNKADDRSNTTVANYSASDDEVPGDLSLEITRISGVRKISDKSSLSILTMGKTDRNSSVTDETMNATDLSSLVDVITTTEEKSDIVTVSSGVRNDGDRDDTESSSYLGDESVATLDKIESNLNVTTTTTTKLPLTVTVTERIGETAATTTAMPTAVFPVTPKILTEADRTTTVETFTLRPTDTVKAPEANNQPFGIAADLDPSEIQKRYRAKEITSTTTTSTTTMTTMTTATTATTVTLASQSTIQNDIYPVQSTSLISNEKSEVSVSSTTAITENGKRVSGERSPEVRARNLSDKSKDKDDVLPIMHLYNTSDIFNGSGQLDGFTRGGTERPRVVLPMNTEAKTKNEKNHAMTERTSGSIRISSTTENNIGKHISTTLSIPISKPSTTTIPTTNFRKDKHEENRVSHDNVSSPAFRGSSSTPVTNRIRYNRPAYHHSILPEYNGTIYPAGLNRTFLETGPISVSPRESMNISDVISKRHDGDVIATQETVAVVSYILATLVVFPIAVGVGLILRRLILRNRKVLEESDTSSEISCRKDAVNIENGDFKTSIEKAITKLPRIQHLCHEAEKPPPPPCRESKWEFSRDKLRLQTVLGQGNFGQVWKAEADDLTGHQGTTRLVAVKTVKEGASDREKEDLVRELEIMQQLGSHPNVVTLLGCCTEEEPHYLILEYVMYGKLLAYLRDHRTRQYFYNFSEDSAALTSRDLTVFGYCVARGMEYLASKKIIHRDLAARNVLVDHNKLCKIADFGMSRFANEDGEVIETRHGRNALPIRWMAPESLIYSLFTTKTDVWSFGILMWEIVTLGSTPYPDMTAREVMRNVHNGYRLERPSHCRSELFRVISRCWHADPDRRPEFQILRRDLAQLLEDNMNGHYVDLESFASECTD